MLAAAGEYRRQRTEGEREEREEGEPVEDKTAGFTSLTCSRETGRGGQSGRKPCNPKLN